MVLGRDATADIHLDNRALSRRHAQIEKRGAAIWIRDLGSQNGTFVNGERINAPQPLNTDDVVEVGRYQVHIQGVDHAKEDTPVLTLTGPEGKHRFAMVGDEIIIGRAPSCDIAIGHKSISRRHLRVSVQGDTFYAEDLGSQNGSKLGGKRINGPTPFTLGEQIQMSEFTVELGFLDAGGNSAGPAPDRANKTMMIDRSELAKAAYVDGDFERMRSSAGRLALGRPGGKGSGENPTGARFDLSDEQDETRGMPGGYEANPELVRGYGAHGTGQSPTLPPDPPTPAATPAPTPSPVLRPRMPRLSVSHPEVSEREVEMHTSSLVFGEDGSDAPAPTGRNYADQGYVVFMKTEVGVSVTAAGDRRLVCVNGKPQLVAQLNEGDTVEFGLLTVVYHSS